MSINKVILLGNIGRDPEIKRLESGTIASFTLATTKKGFTTKSGKQIPDKTQWHNITVFGGLADVAEKYLKKGMKLYVEGEIRYITYDKQNGEKGYVTEIFADNFEMCSQKSDTTASNGTSLTQSTTTLPEQQKATTTLNQFAKPVFDETPIPPQGIGGDDLPF